MFRLILLTVLLLSTIGSQASAQECKQYSGRVRLDCVTQRFPAAAAKRQRCEDEGRKMGLSNQRDPRAGGLMPYVFACMRR
ncbi:hypothetical protein ACVWXO_002958 [Bradyrhizobium sp. LM2.7]